jgi:hypothetical protein
VHNTFVHDGYFGNPSNSDFGQIAFTAGQPQNCFIGNDDPQGSAPPDLEKIQSVCGPITKAPNTGGPLLAQVLCDSGFGACPPGAKYPKSKSVRLTTVPKNLPTMPDPCEGVPNDLWCPSVPIPGSALPAHGPGDATPFGFALVGGLGFIAGPAARRSRRSRRHSKRA